MSTRLEPTHLSVGDLLAQLRGRAADRPAHAAYLAAMEAAAAPLAAQGRHREASDAALAVEPPKGVSGRVADALTDDLCWIIEFEEPVPEGMNRAGYPNAYRERRVTDARAASDRQRSRDRVVQYGPILINWSGTEKS